MLGITNVSNAPSIVLKDTVVSTWNTLPSTGTDSDMKTQGYTYYASIDETGVTESTIAEVTFSDADAKSGNYAPVCRTYADEIRVYSKVNTQIMIPSIIIHSIVESYYELDNSPVSGSTKAVTSGGVYNAMHIDETVTFTPNDYFISSISRGDIRYNGRYVFGFLQLVVNGIPATNQIVLGSFSKTAKYPNGNGITTTSLSGTTGVSWVAGNDLQYYSTAVVGGGDHIVIQILYEAL